MRWGNYLVGVAGVVLTVALASALLLSTTIETVDAAEYTVNIRDFSFNPSSFTLQVGDVVRWENTGAVPHTASSDTGVWDSGTLSPGGVFSHQFLTPGTFPYFCRIHPSMMRATITVQGPAPTATAVPSPPPTQTPAPPPPPPPTDVPAPAPTGVPAPPPTAVPEPPAEPPPPPPTPRAPELWLAVLEATPAYSMTDDVLWIASPGEWYRVLDQDAGWALAVWEFDPPDLTVWMELDGRVEVAVF